MDRPSERDLDEEPFPRDLLDHAIRCWDAEVENSRRLAARLNLLLATTLGLLSFGAYGLGQMPADSPQGPGWGPVLVRVILLGALVLFTRALLVLLRVRSWDRERPAASSRLRLPRDLARRPGESSPPEACSRVFERTYSAFIELQRRNAAEKKGIDQGQQALLMASLFLLAAVACHTLVGALNPVST